jgi:tetratricopeptide (TPR) repeat protein
LNLAAHCRDKRHECPGSDIRNAELPTADEPVMRTFASPFIAVIVLTATLSTTAARAGTDGEPPVACAAISNAAPAKLIDSCAVLIDNPATPAADRLDAMVAQALARHTNGQTDQAFDELNQVLAQDTNSARAYRARGEILRQQRKSVEAFDALNQAIRLDPQYAEAYETRANVFNNVGKYDRAIEDYNEALRLKPDFALAYADRGAAWYFKGEYQKAIDDDDQAIKLDPNRAQTYTNRGAAWRKLGNIQRALDDETSAIRIDPTRPEFFDNRGLDLAGNGDYASAIADYDEAIKIRPEAKFLTNRGDAHQAMKNYDRAIADYDAALNLDAKFQRAYNNRGAARQHQGDRARALQDYAEAVRLNPSDAKAADNYKSVSLELERLGALPNAASLPSFNCAVAKRQVEKAICADPELARLDRNMNDAFLKAIASAEGDSHRAALNLTRQQREFIEKRNASYGRAGYDLRNAMAERLDQLSAISK